MDDGDFVVVKILNKLNLQEKNFKIKNIIDTLVILVELKKPLQKNFTIKNLVKFLN